MNDGNQKNLQLEVNMCNLAVSLSEWSTERWWWCTKIHVATVEEMDQWMLAHIRLTETAIDEIPKVPMHK